MNLLDLLAHVKDIGSIRVTQLLASAAVGAAISFFYLRQDLAIGESRLELRNTECKRQLEAVEHARDLELVKRGDLLQAEVDRAAASKSEEASGSCLVERRRK